jgi:hypothetical protein
VGRADVGKLAVASIEEQNWLAVFDMRVVYFDDARYKDLVIAAIIPGVCLAFKGD